MGQVRGRVRTFRRYGIQPLVAKATGKEMIPFRYRGARLCIAADNSALYHLNNSMDKMWNLASQVPHGEQYVLDVGANAGIFAAMVLERNAQAVVACVEPDVHLKSTIEANLRGRALILETAISDVDGGTAVLHTVPSSRQTNSLLASAARAFGSVSEVEVPLRTIDSIVEELQWPRLDVLKIDIQGMERAALRGAEKSLLTVGTLLIEVTFLDPDPGGLLQQIAASFAEPPEVINAVHLGADLAYRRQMSTTQWS